mmetsp:Transcript_8354/g.20629  ORF Transcript_8354/g.20629 Transcript_8354/m.20629 type:complete len:313 (-) Transcript_8354:860-1798(-)
MCRGDKPGPDERKADTPLGRSLSLSDFFDTTNPWDLRNLHPESAKIRKWFAFVPERFREGQWLPLATWTMFFMFAIAIYVTIDANIKYQASNTGGVIMKNFVGDQAYKAFTIEWYYNISLFSWMTYISWSIHGQSSSFGPWVAFTLWSWTIITIRHGLCSIAPFLPSVQLFTGMMRFPVLLSASITFGIWNFILMPVITFGFLKGKRRMNFVRWAFTWRLCQIHVFNILFAYLNCIWTEPQLQPLHMGDVNAGVIYMLTYVFFYYFILDRIGIQLYPIFSPRTYICIPSWVLAIGVCIGNYKFWNYVLSAEG